MKSWEAKIKTIECPICKRTWEEGCQQETIIKTHGSCAVCRYDEKPPEDMTVKKFEAEFRDMFAEHIKSGFPIGYFQHLNLISPENQECSHKTRIGVLAGANVAIDTEYHLRALEGVTRAFDTGGVLVAGDGTRTSMEELVMASRESGNGLVVIDSNAALALETELTVPIWELSAPTQAEEPAWAQNRAQRRAEKFKRKANRRESHLDLNKKRN